MSKELVVVESPAKARTIARYLGPRFRVVASYGHIRDLPKSRFGVDTENGFTPTYVIPREAKKAVAELKRAAQDSTGLWLATDMDREGEAIAWHVAQVLGYPLEEVKRVTFTEVTPAAIREAFQNPRGIDKNLVGAQQARRVLDRMVGYTLSPLLWKKVRRGLSGGRVQSAALKLVVDREKEIRAFVPEEYWTIQALLAGRSGEPFLARLVERGGEKLRIPNRDQAEEHARVLAASSLRVREVRKRRVKRTPPPPFTTSTLQQEASRRLGFSPKKTMALAQQLYEGVELGREGRVGLITYMRTDSVNLSTLALEELSQVVREVYGERYALPTPRRYRTRQRLAQEAHEAIRPTSAKRLPDHVAPYLTRDQTRLYTLIWQRAVATQMAEALYDQVHVEVEAGDYLLRATGSTLAFDGYLRVYREDQEEREEQLLPPVEEGEELTLLDLVKEQHFTEPPPRYTDATLIKAMEENGIGRPSTYAPTVSTLLERGYVRQEGRKLFATDLGIAVADFLSAHFPEIVDLGFTARLEEDLDEIAEGKRGWVPVVAAFWEPWKLKVSEKEREVAREEVVTRPSEELCPSCGAPMVGRLGRYGWFLSCSRWPECKGRLPGTAAPENGQEHGEGGVGGAADEGALVDTPTEGAPEQEQTESCPLCGSPMLLKKGRFGAFWGCSRYPSCSGTRPYIAEDAPPCPACEGGRLLPRRSRHGKRFWGCSRYPDCTYVTFVSPRRARKEGSSQGPGDEV